MRALDAEEWSVDVIDSADMERRRWAVHNSGGDGIVAPVIAACRADRPADAVLHLAARRAAELGTAVLVASVVRGVQPISLDLYPPVLDQYLYETASTALFVETVCSLAHLHIPWRIHVVRGPVAARLAQLIDLYDARTIVVGPQLESRWPLRHRATVPAVRRRLANLPVEVLTAREHLGEPRAT